MTFPVTSIGSSFATADYFSSIATLAAQNQFLFRKKHCGHPCPNRLICRFHMKCDMTNSILTFVLGVLVVAGAILTVQTINHARELNQLTAENLTINQNYARLQALANEVTAYDQKYPNPALTRILQGH